MSRIAHLTKPLLALALALSAAAIAAAPLPKSSIPEPLRAWVPWVLHGHEMLACPPAFHSADVRACVWPGHLSVEADSQGASFHAQVQVYGAAALVELPGEPGLWPQEVRAGTQALAVTAQDDRPVVRLAPGTHMITGRLRWTQIPQDLRLPRAAGSVALSLNDKPLVATPDAEGRVWLQQPRNAALTNDALTMRTARLIDDDIPMGLTTHIELAVAGKPREIDVPAALLPDFVAVGLDSPLPARLQDDGHLKVQVRAGNWTLRVSGRRMAPTQALSLPEGAADELWSFVPHNALRVVTVEGLASVDPKQVPVPEDWRAHPAYQIKAGQTLRIIEARRGNPEPAADRLTLKRLIWLDFDGQGYTLQDTLGGRLSRTWRLDLAAPGVLGRATANGQDQPVTRLAGSEASGVEVRSGGLALKADSRIEGDARTLPATGWMADFNTASSELRLPPGWRLMHVGGVDRAEGAWASRWTLYDFFFVLLGIVAAGRLLGRKTALAVATALVLTWHMPGAPQGMWIVLIGLLALVRVLPAGRLHQAALWGTRASVLVIGLWLLPYAIDQLRLVLHPSLERPGVQAGTDERYLEQAAPPVAASPAPAAEPMQENLAVGADASVATAGIAREAAPALKAPLARRQSTDKAYRGDPLSSVPLQEIDPSVRVQTGPGLPAWNWTTHPLRWMGPVQAAQQITLYLLPPWANALFRLGGLIAMLLALRALAAAMPPWTGAHRESSPAKVSSDGAAPMAAGAVLAWVVAAALAGVSVPGWAAGAEPDTSRNAPVQPPDATLLDQLRDKLTAPPDCLPRCADLARLQVEARDHTVLLRLEVHALAEVAIPLPGQGSHWRPAVITLDGHPAITRRDEAGALWLAVPEGLSRVTLAADVGTVNDVELALPMLPRAVQLDAPGWTVTGLDARGLASGALTLAREAAASPDQATERGVPADALAPFVRVERSLHLGLRWTMETRITRAAPSRLPLRVRVRLLEGESVNDEVVRVEDGHAVVQLGAEERAAFTSTLKESPRLAWLSTREPHQIEVWQLLPSAQWHSTWSGLAPVQLSDGPDGRLAPQWQPWPGEQVVLDVSKPAGVPGQTLTIDQWRLSVSPGLRATDFSSVATLRSSQGGHHSLSLPEGAEFLGLMVDGQAQPLQPQGRKLLVPVVPGQHTVQLDWREARGMSWLYRTSAPALGTAGVNASTLLRLPPERVVLAAGGPRVGPAVLFWGVLIALGGLAVALGRTRFTPLGVGAWLLLALGLAPTSLLGAAVVCGWFFAVAARQRLADGPNAPMTQWGPGARNAVQVGLLLWTLLAASFLLNAIRIGLLGYPDLMVTGNGSHAGLLSWYQDRIADAPQTVWVLSAPVLAYRLLMLAWALWLALSLVRWVKWAWEAYSQGGYWHAVAWPARKKATDAPIAPSSPSL